ncbi:MAG: hypothetical protein HDR20_10830 [Lachnospiraceae bacterium]|nr:hypothetical protein [Lachnospiraceae bacterium]
MNGLDYASYEKYFDAIIAPVISEYCDSTADVVVLPNIKDKIWNYYVEFNEHCKNEYMRDKNKLLDRHKVVACYMFAILKTNPMVCVIAFQNGDKSSMLLNERLALCFGMTLLRALICDEIEKLDDSELKEKVTAVFENDILFPQANHGDYKGNLLSQLYHTKSESNYNVLGLAETLYLLEVFNLVKNGIQEDVFKKE